MLSRTAQIAVACLLLLSCWFTYTKVSSQSSQVAPPPGLRANKNTFSPLLEVLAPKRTRVTDEQLAKLKTMQIENLWGAVQNKGYRHCFINHLKLTTPGLQTAGRALTMRYLPVRPDLDEGVQQLAKEGNWDYRFNTRAGEDAQPGDIVVVELGGMVDRATFMGTMTGLAIKLRKTNGIIVDGGIRDLSGFKEFKDFPVFYAGAHASAMADQVGVEWNAPVRIGQVTVLPGDVIVGDEEGVLVFPPQITDEVIKAAEAQTLVEDFKAEKMKEGKHPTRDIYPRLSPALEKEFEEWKKKRAK
jgi:4-hydroxy-4-methyl-2-oxoglutarate aldolase